MVSGMALAFAATFAGAAQSKGPYTWQARVAVKRPGAWRLVIPNWSLQGYAMPLPLVRTIRVR